MNTTNRANNKHNNPLNKIVSNAVRNEVIRTIKSNDVSIKTAVSTIVISSLSSITNKRFLISLALLAMLYSLCCASGSLSTSSKLKFSGYCRNTLCI